VLDVSPTEIFQHHSQGLGVDLYDTCERMIDNDDNEQSGELSAALNYADYSPV
jgi:hypothetical protein